jgi:Carboxypeptidase regulatory-like domain/TonB-dependent Receptor Plug Domain
MNMRRVAVILGLLFARALGAQGGAVALLVIDDATDAPLADARVSIVGQTSEGVTDARGRFLYVVPRPGKVVLILRRIGYHPGTMTVDVSASDTARVTYAMTAAMQTLTTVAVTDTLNSASPFLAGFDRRLASHAGSASYITRTEIETRKPSLTTDLLRRVSSLTIIDSSGTLMAVSRRIQKPNIRNGGVVMDLKNCPMQVAVDGQLREWGFAVNTIAPEEIHGIEVYPGPATIPAEFASMKRDANCGLIMIWTRRAK